ncbi:MAG: V-type ATP synthase subunit F [Dehalococcoidales bacterium]|nr:V-type ATP synthase subunit F [Dehalococcoidales bacterium]
MVEVKHLGIAVIGNKDLVNGLRLAGISRYHIIEDGASVEEIRKAVGEELAEPGVAIIVMLEEYARHIDDLLARIQGKRVSPPVVVEVPSRYGTRYEDVAQYYKAYIRKFIGFDIEI